MALKVFEKLKSVQTSKVSDVVSGAKSTLSSILKKSETQEVATDEQPQEANEQWRKLASSAQELEQKVAQYFAENGEKVKQWYSDSKLDEKLTKVARKAGATIIYPVLLLYNIMRSPNTPVKQKAMIVLPLAYFIMPADMIPDVLLGLGYVDDGMGVMACVKSVSESITPEIQEETAQMCKNIAGEVDKEVLAKISSVVEDNAEKIDSKLADAGAVAKKMFETKK